ncbi:RNA-directed DNA polymerase from mobile element [Brachionus plicatilis]|uniref:RNA-directed DNA polymerase from mobile element n=1 Tax=Brachionus plicatilis TaxID=10195 RepID=A0A3M7SJ68_BRAPC|nr:RNA-directed DNA polymerase from mobile element [Brachionus plicatilis]
MLEKYLSVQSDKQISKLFRFPNCFRIFSNKQKNMAHFHKCEFDEPATTKEITSAIKRLKEEAASGPDQIHNLILRESKIPNAWISANITMIPKKSIAQDPANYRPISMKSCLGKLLERIVYSRLQYVTKS